MNISKITTLVFALIFTPLVFAMGMLGMDINDMHEHMGMMMDQQKLMMNMQ